MKFARRRFLQLTGGAVALPAISRIAKAETYPSRPVRVIVGLPSGTSPDIVARLIGQWLSQRLGQPFVVVDLPGAATNIGTAAVAHATADGYTLLLVTAGNTVNESVYKKLNYDFIRDIAPVASIGGIPFVMVVNPTLPAKTVPEFIAYAKANPGKIYMASSGIGSTPHVLGVLFEIMAGVDLFHVPYHNSLLLLPDLLGGQVQVAFEPVPAVLDFIYSRKLYALAATTKQRLEVLSAVPALNEFVPGYEASGWLGVGAPKSTPAEIISKLNVEINAGLADPKTKARLTDLGGIPNSMTPADFGKFIVEETAKWAKVVKFAGIEPV